jgi:hypothetical protein
MDEKECIQFLKEFRDTIDKYLFLGYSPANNPFAKDYKQMHEINRSEFFIIDISQTDNDIWFYAGYIQGAGKLPISLPKMVLWLRVVLLVWSIQSFILKMNMICGEKWVRE